MGLTTLIFLFISFITSHIAHAAPAFTEREVVAVTVVETSRSTTTASDWAAGGVAGYPIHPSCNATERLQLERALSDTIKLAQHAKEHILRFGNSSGFYTKYFGDAPTAEPIGWYERVVSADRTGMKFRCDDPDGNCKIPGWGGHWRGDNATQETVICELSFSTRWPLEALCGHGYTVAAGKTSSYFAADLLHRLFHIPRIAEGVIGHYAGEGEYADVLELARTNATYAVRDSDSLQYFALDVYAYDIALPGEGCTGQALANSTFALTPIRPMISTATATPPSDISPETPSATTTASQACHTHVDGTVHCE